MSDIHVGYKDNGEPLRYTEDGHLILTAPTGSGKPTDMLAGICLTYRGRLIVIDPKAQLAAITKRRREQFGRVHIFARLLHDSGNDSGSGTVRS